MHVNLGFQKPYDTLKKWHVMTNIDAINPRCTKTYGVTKNHGFP
jgi:hypothetical protein